MLRPRELESDQPHGPWSCRGCDIWDAIRAAERGDAGELRRLLDRDPNLYRAEYWYTQPAYFAVREGHLEAVRVLLDAGADPSFVSLAGDDLITVARDRGHDDVVRLLEEVRAERGEPAAPESESGYAAHGFEPVDLALWTGPFWNVRGDLDGVRRLIEGGVEVDLTIAAALGDLERVRDLLDDDSGRIREARPSGKRPLSTAIEFGHEAMARLLLERGADPNWPEGATAPRGVALHAAARNGDRTMVELLLDHGADPNATIDSSGSATWVATPELRPLLLDYGGMLDAYDLIWLDEDDAVVARVTADPGAANDGCGGVFAAACKLGKRDLVVRLLDAGARVPDVVTACRSYLWCDPDLLRLLLDSGMDPNLPDWLHATPLHDLCSRDGRGRPRPHRTDCAAILLDAGADADARDEDFSSTPLGWAARNDLPDMVELLLARGAASEPADSEPWATPLAWATRRGHGRIVQKLRQAGATA